MSQVHELRVPGRSGGANPREQVVSPYSGELLGEIEQASAEDLEHALGLQTALHQDRDRWLPTHARIAVLKKSASIMEGRAEELALQIAQEGGKPLTDARIEVARAVNGMELLAEEASHNAGSEIPMGVTAASVGRLVFTTREPIGVVAAVSAFNHPLNLIVHQAAPAIAAGCPVLVKPAPPTPLSCISLVEIMREAGLPEEWCICLPCSNEVAEKLVTSNRIAFFSFIGSARVGWYLKSKLAPGVRCALEHGGAAPLIVDESADLDKAIPLIVKGGYYHAGQVCVSVQRVFAHLSKKAELVERLTAAIQALRTGDPTSADTDVGPLIRQGEVDRVDEWVTEAASAGARIAIGAKTMDHQCYEPTLIVDPGDDTKVMQSEIFGPVVCVTEFRDLDEAVRRCNSLPWAFQAAIVAQDIDRALRTAQRLDAAAVMINDHTAFRVDWMPFGGRRESGLGMGGMPYTVEDLTQSKMVVMNIG